MIFKRIFIFVVCGTFLINPLGEIQAETNRQARLQRIELNAALQRLELNKKGMTYGKLWQKVRPDADRESRAFMDRWIGLNPSRKLPKFDVVDISNNETTSFRIQVSEGKNSMVMELFQSENEDSFKVKIGRSVFTSEELEKPEKWLKRYAEENSNDFSGQQLKEFQHSQSSIVLNAKELKKLTGRERAMYFLNLRYLLVSAHEVQLINAERRSKDQAQSVMPFEPKFDFFTWMVTLFTTAQANQAGNCVVAGWGSRFLERGAIRNGVSCPFPEEGDAAQNRTKCGNNQAPCNPAIFGLSNRSEGTPHCIPFTFGRVTNTSQRATLACHQTSHLDGGQPATVALLRSMERGNPDWFTGDSPKPEHLQAAIDLAENIRQETNRAFDLCRLDRTGTELTSPSREVSADRFNKTESYDQDLAADSSEAKQKLACEVLASRRTALDATIREWRQSLPPPQNGDCPTRPGGVVQQPLPPAGSNDNPTQVIVPGPGPAEGICPPTPPPTGPVTQDKDWWKTPALILGGLALFLGGLCLARVLSFCKKKKKTPVQEPVPPIQTPGEPPPPPPPPVGEGGNRVAPPAGGVRQTPPVQQTQQPGAGGIR